MNSWTRSWRKSALPAPFTRYAEQWAEHALERAKFYFLPVLRKMRFRVDGGKKRTDARATQNLALRCSRFDLVS
jgi:hypothetical protein